MTGPEPAIALGQLERELAYYRRECNDLGARLLRLQEEQSNTFREARRSRTVAKLIREAYRLADGDGTPDKIGGPMLEMIIDNALCDGAALLREERTAGAGHFQVMHTIGTAVEQPGQPVWIPSPPDFFYTTSRTPIEPPAYELTGILRMQAEMELRNAKAVAERASAARARFLATLTHELRTPLNAVIGYSEMMVPGSRYTLTTDDRQRYARLIHDAARYLLKLADGILDYSRIEQTLPSLAAEWLPAEELLESPAAIAAGEGRARAVAVTLLPVDPALELYVDPLRFRQVLQNLLANAVKFSRPTGAVELGIERLANGAARLRICDHGIGMRPEDIPRALEPFQQIDAGVAREQGGAGLGLPIAKSLLEAHGGEMTIDSALGEGTTIAITLPSERVREVRDC